MKADDFSFGNNGEAGSTSIDFVGHVAREGGPEKAACPPGMVFVPGGSFRMGSDAHYREEAPAHRVKVDGFFIDKTPVTNRQFKAFVPKRSV